MDVIARIKRRFSPPPPPDLDASYRGMYAPHAQTHAGVAGEMAAIRDSEGLGKQLLEIACGSGCNVENLVASGFEYFGLDISEPAIALAIQKHPRGRYLNLAGADLRLLADGCFDMVYSSSMLEHVAEHREFLTEMIRLARRHLYVLFYEGLPLTETKIELHPGPYPYPMFGVKLMDYHEKISGWYMNRYSRSDILAIAQQSQIAGVEILDRDNRPYFAGMDSILHIWK